jgi:hypothetical protein
MFNAIFIKFFKLHIQATKLFAFRPNMERQQQRFGTSAAENLNPKFLINLELGLLPIDWYGQRGQVKNARRCKFLSSSE